MKVPPTRVILPVEQSSGIQSGEEMEQSRLTIKLKKELD